MSESGPRYIIVGTAGHIDHGKTELIRKLTGIDTDRLKEEKERGITIDLGFAYLDLPKGNRVGIVDVPGHERFIRNMLAGATGIDFLLLIIAGDAGVMPQTVEHMQICELLGISSGLIVVTKKDIVDEDWLVLVMDEIETFVQGTFLEGAPIIPVSSISGDGIPALIEAMDSAVPLLKTRSDDKNFRMPIDRAFTIKGFGTVVTGTISTGSIRTGDTLAILPGDNSGRVRTLQVHHEKVDQAWAGQRVAVNLHGIEKQSVLRGQMLCELNSFRTTMMIDARLTVLKDSPRPLKYRSRVHFHSGTAEIMARVIPLDGDHIDPGNSGYVQIRFEEPFVAIAEDRFVLRSCSPLRTIAGGKIIIPSAAKRNRFKKNELKTLSAYEKTTSEEKILLFVNHAGLRGISIESLIMQLGNRKESILQALNSFIEKGKLHSIDRDYSYILDSETMQSLNDTILAKVRLYHKLNRLRSGITKEELRSSFPYLSLNAFNNILEYLYRDRGIQQSGDRISLPDHEVQLKPDERKMHNRIKEIIKTRKFNVPTLSELVAETGETQKKIDTLLRMMVESDEIILVKPNLVFSRELMNDIIAKIRDFFHKTPQLTIADVKSLFGYSRKHAIPLLEYLDSMAITERKKDFRVLGLTQK